MILWERIVNGETFRLYRANVNRPGRWYWVFLTKGNEVVYQTLTNNG